MCELGNDENVSGAIIHVVNTEDVQVSCVESDVVNLVLDACGGHGECGNFVAGENFEGDCVVGKGVGTVFIMLKESELIVRPMVSL